MKMKMELEMKMKMEMAKAAGQWLAAHPTAQNKPQQELKGKHPIQFKYKLNLKSQQGTKVTKQLQLLRHPMQFSMTKC